MAGIQIGDVLVSPDGETEVTVTSPAQIVELKFAGWTPKHRRPERRPRRPDTASKPAPSATEQPPRPATHPDSAT